MDVAGLSDDGTGVYRFGTLIWKPLRYLSKD